MFPFPRRPSNLADTIRLAVGIALLIGFILTALGDHQWPIGSTPPPQVAPPPPTITKGAPPPCAADPAPLPAPRDRSGRLLDYWHTCGTQIVDRFGHPIHIAGVAWYGMDLPDAVPQGLDQRNYESLLGQVKNLGFNVVRIPFSSESIQPGHDPVGINYTLNPDLRGLTSLQVLDRLIAACHLLGLKVILDHHRISPWSHPGLWYDGSYSDSQWISDWQRLARRYAGNDTVIAIDLQNEPYEATWGTGDPKTDWRIAAERGGNAVLAANPYVLIFVQGIATYQGENYWWGGQLRGVATAPVRLDISGRLVYSPHEYGPSVYPQSWFSAADYPSNLPSIWNTHWGFIFQQRIAPVVLGEVGAPSVGYGVGGTWQRVLLSYLEMYHIGFVMWALNPGATDTGSVFESDWLTVNAARQKVYAPYLDHATSIWAR